MTVYVTTIKIQFYENRRNSLELSENSLDIIQYGTRKMKSIVENCGNTNILT